MRQPKRPKPKSRKPNIEYRRCKTCDHPHIHEVTCNGCGGSCKVDQHGSPGFYGLIKGEVIGGYYSPVLRDCMRYRFALCEKCVRKLFDGFVVPVEEQDVDIEGRPITKDGISILEPG